MDNKKNINALLGLAAASFMVAAQPAHAEKKAPAKATAEKAAADTSQCDGKNACGGVDAKCKEPSSCKGKGECATAKNSCKGHNACKGKGWVMSKSAECTKKKN